MLMMIENRAGRQSAQSWTSWKVCYCPFVDSLLTCCMYSNVLQYFNFSHSKPDIYLIFCRKGADSSTGSFKPTH